MSITDPYTISAQWGILTAPLEKQLTSANGLAGSVIDRLHETGRRQFAASPFPDRKNEDWKYTPLRELFNTQYTGAPSGTDRHLPGTIPSLAGAVRLLFLNGVYTPHLSDPLPAGIWVGALADAIADSTRTKALDRIAGLLEHAQMTPFEALATAALQQGVCIFIDSGVHIEAPIHCIHFNTHSETPYSTSPYKCIVSASHSSAHIVEHFAGEQTAKYFTNTVSHVHVSPGAHLKHYRIQSEPEDSIHIGATRVFQDRDSTYTSLAVETGGLVARNNIEAIHLGTGITSNLYGVFKGADRRHLDTQSFIDHAHPHCVSNELYKGILDGYARGVFNGKIIVRPDAQKTNAFQQNSTLLLSPGAVMDSKPQLEIFADDVRCSHGATIGHLNEDALFYLRSRGLDATQASAMLQHAFIGEVLDHCPHADIRAYLDEHIIPGIS